MRTCRKRIVGQYAVVALIALGGTVAMPMDAHARKYTICVRPVMAHLFKDCGKKASHDAMREFRPFCHFMDTWREVHGDEDSGDFEHPWAHSAMRLMRGLILEIWHKADDGGNDKFLGRFISAPKTSDAWVWPEGSGADIQNMSCGSFDWRGERPPNPYVLTRLDVTAVPEAQLITGDIRRAQICNSPFNNGSEGCLGNSMSGKPASPSAPLSSVFNYHKDLAKRAINQAQTGEMVVHWRWLADGSCRPGKTWKERGDGVWYTRDVDDQDTTICMTRQWDSLSVSQTLAPEHGPGEGAYGTLPAVLLIGAFLADPVVPATHFLYGAQKVLQQFGQGSVLASNIIINMGKSTCPGGQKPPCIERSVEVDGKLAPVLDVVPYSGKTIWFQNWGLIPEMAGQLLWYNVTEGRVPSGYREDVPSEFAAPINPDCKSGNTNCDSHMYHGVVQQDDKRKNYDPATDDEFYMRNEYDFAIADVSSEVHHMARAMIEGWSHLVTSVTFWDPNKHVSPELQGVKIDSEPKPFIVHCYENRRVPLQYARAFWDLIDKNIGKNTSESFDKNVYCPGSNDRYPQTEQEALKWANSFGWQRLCSYRLDPERASDFAPGDRVNAIYSPTSLLEAFGRASREHRYRHLCPLLHDNPLPVTALVPYLPMRPIDFMRALGGGDKVEQTFQFHNVLFCEPNTVGFYKNEGADASDPNYWRSGDFGSIGILAGNSGNLWYDSMMFREVTWEDSLGATTHTDPKAGSIYADDKGVHRDRPGRCDLRGAEGNAIYVDDKAQYRRYYMCDGEFGDLVLKNRKLSKPDGAPNYGTTQRANNECYHDDRRGVSGHKAKYSWQEGDCQCEWPAMVVKGWSSEQIPAANIFLNPEGSHGLLSPGIGITSNDACICPPDGRRTSYDGVLSCAFEDPSPDENPCGKNRRTLLAGIICGCHEGQVKIVDDNNLIVDCECPEGMAQLSRPYAPLVCVGPDLDWGIRYLPWKP